MELIRLQSEALDGTAFIRDAHRNGMSSSGKIAMPLPPPFRGCIYEHITECIGHTPLVKLHRVTGDAKATVICKLESLNPLWSVKDRIGVFMIEDAERTGKINKSTVI